ncbi:MAG: RnfABCDGE type electron transport complex subunit A [Deltaproteobacteria bacterium]|nr:RnfABCDGE type electron transport complex subunit A [Deltaproteobacteria bacterium]MBW2075152.1 RnfABCDGE type electron transport complex subunit A [Deltaproteobacteria bacterium]RLB81024.1 MAG: electron transport complex subunit RsxA [Deltaproteobacteria bacterium]
MGDYILLAISAILVNNILLIQYLGNCPFLGTSKKMDTAVGMAMAVVFVLTMAGIVTWILETVFLKPLGLEYIRTIVFILVIAALVQFVELFLKKSIPALYAGLGIFLPLITTNCAVMGVCLINIKEEYNFLEMLVSSLAYPAGFGLALILFAGIRERIIIGRVPTAMQDTAIGLVTAGFMSLSFLGFKGMI